MTNEQTLEQFLLAWNSNAYLNMCTSNDMENVINALEKQIPMSIRREKYFYGTIPYCPVCNKQLTEWASKLLCDNYCRVCGQALDWSEDE